MTNPGRARISSILCVATLWAMAGTAAAQLTTPPAPAPTPPDTEGKEIGGFKVSQSIDFGGRITSVSGSEAMYDTLVNQQSGPRILEQSLTMMSISHQDIFDTLTLNSFGWGGDPEQALRFRVSKYRWYNLTGSYQHMQNYWNYDLFANPLNPTTANPYLPVLNSPHAYYNRQNLYNFGIVILPMQKISFRLDYNRNRFVGPSFSSNHQGTEALTNQNTNNTLNAFRFGTDIRLTQKTTLSYTQSLQYYSGKTNYSLNPYNSYVLPNGSSVSFGLPWLNGGSPCAVPVTNGVANPVCNGFFGYSQTQNVYTTIPTEQINLKSTSIKNLDFNAQYQYSAANMHTPVDETFAGLVTRTGVRGFDSAGSNSTGQWVSSSADISATYSISEKLRLVETFRFRNWRSQGTYLNLQNNYFGAASAGGASLTNPIVMWPTTVPGHSSSSPADVINEYWVNLDGENTKENDFQVQYDISRYFGVHTGFRWTGDNIQPGSSYEASLGDIYYPNNPNRGDCVGVPLNPDGSCTFVGVLAPYGNPTVAINNYSWLIGMWFQKGNFHAHADAQFGSANNYAYRIDPRTGQNISGSVMYTPKSWLSLGANLMFQRATNYTGDVAYNNHNYSAMFNATLTPSKFWSLDLGYNFDAIQQDANVCYPGTYPLNSFPCFDGSGLNETNAFYNTHTQFGYFALSLKPVTRVAVRLGYSIIDNNGDTTQFNIYQPLGPLVSRYQLPLAGFDYTFYKNITFRAGWNYQNYNEGSFIGPTAPRAFHANETTLALRYSF
jgi:hypothetical protein